MKPTLSVITICFNNLQDLLVTCKSVDEQSIVPDEHLIIDGSTNEEIVQWLMNNPQPSYRHWIHERDAGISDAFNKGIIHAKYSITHLLNSGDRYAHRTAIDTALHHFVFDEKLMWLHSQYIQHRGGVDVTSGVAFDKNKLWKGMRTVAHPTMFIKKELYEKHGLYKTTYKIAMDYDMLVRIRDEKSVFIPTPLVYFAPGGASNVHFKQGLAEVRKIYHTHIGSSMKLKLWQWRQRALTRFMKTGAGKKWFQMKNRDKIGNKQ
jgi:glycosyltransferase involved in cell wall biosynthesis